MNGIVIIPVHNPDITLIGLVEQIWNYGNQVIIVDDGSEKKCNEIFEQAENMAIVLHHQEKRGKGEAIKTGLSYIEKELWDCDAVGVMDAAGKYHAEDIERLVMKAKQRKMTLFIGVQEEKWNIRIKNRIAKQLFQISSGIHLWDTYFGLWAFDIRLIPKLIQVKGKIPIEEVKLKATRKRKANVFGKKSNAMQL